MFLAIHGSVYIAYAKLASHKFNLCNHNLQTLTFSSFFLDCVTFRVSRCYNDSGMVVVVVDNSHCCLDWCGTTCGQPGEKLFLYIQYFARDFIIYTTYLIYLFLDIFVLYYILLSIIIEVEHHERFLDRS